MGLFSSIGKIFSTAATAVATGGISLVAPKLIPKPISQALQTITTAQFPTSINSALNTLSLTPQGRALLPTVSIAGKAIPLVASGGKLVPGGNMGLDLGGILGTVGGIFGGNQNPVFQGISNVANLAQQFVPQSTALAVRPPISSVPAPRAMTPMVSAAVGRSFFQKFPNLANAIQQLRNRGMHVKRSQLWSLLKRFGPELLVTGGLLTAAAVSELMIAGPGRRTMNPANSKALKRAARRIKSFHRLCQTTDLIKSKRRSGGFTRCGTCRKSPCRC